MNNKGFTLIELLAAIVIVTLVTMITFSIVGETFSVTEEKSYEIFEKNIIMQTKNYILECDNKLINCENDYTWEKVSNGYKTIVNFDIMKKYDYFSKDDFIDPITKNDVSECLLVEVFKDNLFNITVKIDNKKC